MSGYDPQHSFNPLWQGGEPGSGWNPNGPDGQLIDPTAGPHGTPIGQLAQSSYPPLHGWVRGPDGTAIPSNLWNASTPPPGAIQAPMRAATPNQAVLLLLLMS